MIIAERNNLTPLVVLINNSKIKLELFKGDKDDLYLSCNCSKPAGVVYFGTTPSLLHSFLQGSIILQNLFDYGPSIFVEITNEDKKTIYSRVDIEVTLTYGEQSANQLGYAGKIETWGK